MKKSILVLCGFFLPGIVYLVTWRIIPLLYTMGISMTSWNLIRDRQPGFSGVENYLMLWSDPEFHHSLWLSLLFTVIATAIELGIGLALVVGVNGNRRKDLLQTVFLMPMIITPVVVGTIWYLIYHPVLGPIADLLKRLGFGTVDPLGTRETALSSILLGDIWQWTPFVFLILLAGLQMIPRELYEACRVDGTNDWELFRFITLPQLKGSIVTAVILRSMDAFREFDKVMIMTGGGPDNSTEMSSLLIYKRAFQFFDIGYAAAMVIIVLAILSFAYVVYLRSENG
ncbi:MAG: sugar ABC transporter permease [Firmicutes bacterium]|nr:sugar ABC transporter permease [Bacillota bacterium]